MDEKISTAGKEVLVQLVKVAQKRGMQGSKGSWKEFLSVSDKKFGSSVSDPSKRSADILAAFLKTFNREEDVKILNKLLLCHSDHDGEEKSKEKTTEAESAEKRLVGLTLKHPLYSIDYLFPSHEEGWLVTKSSRKSKMMKSTGMIAIDCEMVLCEDGTEALARVCVVDQDLQVKLNELVNPDKAVVDYRTDITGLDAKDFEGVTCSLADIQKCMKRLLSHGTILVGHSLNNDLHALKIDHARVIDTSLIFKYGEETSFRRPSLNNLCKAVLGYEVRKKGAPHNCLDDACAAMKLVLAKIESGSDKAIPVLHEVVSEVDLSKLLLHGVSVNVPSNELHKIIPGDFVIELKPKRKGQGEKYSAFAVFPSQEAANQAFANANGILEKDSSGLPQKCISFQLDSGLAGTLYVRKMALDAPGHVSSRKRSSQVEETASESKKLKSDQGAGDHTCDDHLKEIERLKQELMQKDKEISSLNKIVVALTRKQGL